MENFTIPTISIPTATGAITIVGFAGKTVILIDDGHVHVIASPKAPKQPP